MASKINPTSGNPWRGKDNKFAESPFAAMKNADDELKKEIGESLKKLREKRAASVEAPATERDYFSELPKSAETLGRLHRQQKTLERIDNLAKQRDNATEVEKAKRAQRKMNRLQKELDPDLPQSKQEAYDLEGEIQNTITRNNALTGIDPEMTPTEVAKDFDSWVKKQPAVELNDDQALALKRHMNPNRTDIDPADLIDELDTVEHNDISGLTLVRGTQLGTVSPGDNLKSFAYESFTTDPEVAKVYAHAKQLDRSKKPAVITTKAPNGTTAIIPARFDNTQAAQKEVAIGPGYNLTVQDVFDNGKELEITAKLEPSAIAHFTREPDAATQLVSDSTQFVAAPHSSLNTKVIPESGVDKAYYDLAQKRKYVQEKINEVQGNKDDKDPLSRSLDALDKIDQLAGGDPELEKIGRDLGLKEFEKYLDEKNAGDTEGPLFKSYDSFRDYAHDQAIRWKTEDAIASGEASEADLNGFPPEDRKLMAIFERRGRADGRTPYEQLLHEEDTGGLADVYYDNFALESTDQSETKEDPADLTRKMKDLERQLALLEELEALTDEYDQANNEGDDDAIAAAEQNIAAVEGKLDQSLPTTIQGITDEISEISAKLDRPEMFEDDEDTPFSFDGEGLDYAIEDHLGISEDFETIEEMEAAIRAKGYDITLTFDPEWEDGKVIGGPDRVKLSRKLYPDATPEDRPEMFEDDEDGTWKSLSTDEPVDKPKDNQSSDLLKKINEAEELDRLRNDSRNYQPRKTTAEDLALADMTNSELYDMALSQETQKLPDSPIRNITELYLGHYVTQQKISMLQNQFVEANPATRTEIRRKINELNDTLPFGLLQSDYADRLRALNYAATHQPSKQVIDNFVKDSKIKDPVYHSTSIENLGSIISNGLRAGDGDGEDAFGKGIYFATSEDASRIYNNSRQSGQEQVVAKTYINSTQPKVLSRAALTEEVKKRLGVKSDWDLFKKVKEQKTTVAEILDEYFAQGYDSISVRSKDGAVYVIVRDPAKVKIAEWS